MLNKELYPFWGRLFGFNWKFGVFLIAVVCIPRFFLVLNANIIGNYAAIGLIMTVSALIPFVFLNRQGLKTIGLKKPEKYGWLPAAFAAGLAAAFLLYVLGQVLYGNSYENWYVYIAKSYNIPAGISPQDKNILFAAMAFSGMIFSPVGEELFFRGIVHSSIAESVGNRKASVVDGLAFALTHISHFGLVYIYGVWKFFPAPAVIWVAGMFLVSLLFFACRRRSGSILGAVICHAAFNLGMIYCIFYLL